MYNYALNYSKDVYVFLGHNKDDCFENIITNIINKKNYENLSGMMKFTKISTIQFSLFYLICQKMKQVWY